MMIVCCKVMPIWINDKENPLFSCNERQHPHLAKWRFLTKRQALCNKQ